MTPAQAVLKEFLFPAIAFSPQYHFKCNLGMSENIAYQKADISDTLAVSLALILKASSLPRPQQF